MISVTRCIMYIYYILRLRIEYKDLRQSPARTSTSEFSRYYQYRNRA